MFSFGDRVIYKSVGKPLAFDSVEGKEGRVLEVGWINPDNEEFVCVDFGDVLSVDGGVPCYPEELTKVEQ